MGTRFASLIALVVLPASMLGCADDKNEFTLKRSSKSGTIAISDDGARVLMVNPEDDSVSIFSASDFALVARVRTGDEPSAVVVHPDNATAFVANRGGASVTRINGINTAAPSVTATLAVGSEPTGLALSPGGNLLFVAEWAEGRVSVIGTKDNNVIMSIEAPSNPRAVAVTNNGDLSDEDELLVVPEFFGEPAGSEGTDTSRIGRVRLFRVSGNLPAAGVITLAPLDSGFAPVAAPVMTSPNQLYSVAIQGNKVYVTSISASPAPPSVFNGNVFPVVYVADLGSRAEDRGPAGTANLARKVFDAIPSGTRFALGDVVDLAFDGTTNTAYAVSRAADVVQKVSYDGGVNVGLPQIDLLAPPAGMTACQGPTGIVVGAGKAFVNCWVNRRLAVVDLATQRLEATVESAPFAAGAVEKGRRFFFTGRGRWSREGFSSCGSCHPDGLTDNITWIFAAGPRQTTSLDGSFSHGPGPQKQRVFNWTAIFDETHDFERNTRGTSGGLGAVTISPSGGCGTLAAEVADPATASLPGGLAKPIKELQDRPQNCTRDWDDVDVYMRTIRPPRGLQGLDLNAVQRGRTLFSSIGSGAKDGNCVKCHGGPAFTISRRFFVPSTTGNTALTTTPFVPPAGFPPTINFHTVQIGAQPAEADITGAPVGPPEVACVLRNVGTFGVPADTAATAALERKPDGTRGQGAGGFNVPSLYGLSVGAPYLHHGLARSLDELLSDAKWADHLRAGNSGFLSGGDAAQDRRDLAAFLLSIDAGTPEVAVPPSFDVCP